MKNLVVVMAGDKSLHTEYSVDRDFDLWTIYYGDFEHIFTRYRSFSDRIWRRKGLKFELARRILLEELYFGQNFDFNAYDFIFLPDDDIRFQNRAADISRLFEICRDLNADVFQPAIANEFFSPRWEATRLLPDMVCHRTNLVEIMMHGFSGNAFTKAYLPAIHATQFSKSGWGIEPIIMKIGEAVFRRPLRTFVIDAVPVIHTRPVGSGSRIIHAIGRAELRLIPQSYPNRMRTLGAFARIEEAALSLDGTVPPSADITLETSQATPFDPRARFDRLVVTLPNAWPQKDQK